MNWWTSGARTILDIRTRFGFSQTVRRIHQVLNNPTQEGHRFFATLGLTKWKTRPSTYRVLSADERLDKDVVNTPMTSTKRKRESDEKLGADTPQPHTKKTKINATETDNTAKAQVLRKEHLSEAQKQEFCDAITNYFEGKKGRFKITDILQSPECSGFANLNPISACTKFLCFFH